MDAIADLRSSHLAERSLAVLATLAVIAFLYAGRELFIPVALGVVLALTVHPVVNWLERRKAPRWLAAAVGTLVAAAVVLVIAAVLYDRISEFMAELPVYEDRFHRTWGAIVRKLTHLQRQGDALVKPPGPATGVKVQASVPWTSLIVGTATGAVALVAEATVAVFTLYFVLAEGPRFRQKLLRSMGGDIAAREHAAVALSEIRRDVEQYMVNRVLLNAALGLVTWGIYALYGLEHAFVWGLTTALLHFIPYAGPAVGLALPAAMALLQYGTLKDVGLVSGIYLALVAIQGNVVDPIFLGKQLRLSSTVVFVGSLFWYLIWGPVGLFLAVPLLSATRVACAHLPRTQHFARFLGE